jgi:hypothetical protein
MLAPGGGGTDPRADDIPAFSAHQIFILVAAEGGQRSRKDQGISPGDAARDF